MMDLEGQIIVYTGNGKGKTTAALGLAWRALGRDLPVAVVQFVKGKWKTGERSFAEQLSARSFAERLPQLVFRVMGRGFTWESDDLSRDRAAAEAAWAESRALILGGEHAVVILDELTYVLNYGFVPLDAVLETLRARPRHVSVVVTGRNAPEPLVAVADVVTEMRVVKHPFAEGKKAVPGLDY
jgi:cob(I)alamin adenosyltransferase